MTVHIPVDMHRFFLVVIDYSYDAIGRLQEAVYADSSRSYAYEYDVAGNRLQEQVMIDNTGTPVITTTNWTYNDANQIATMQVASNPVSNFQYDANGNLSSDGQLAYTWDRANRLTTLNNGSYNTHYAYDGNGNGNRVQQTIGGIATDYLLDIQPQLALVLKETTPSETLSYVHSPKGVHAVEDNMGDWHFMVSDGLGSVRSQVDDLAVVEASQAYSPYGQVYGVEGTFTGSFGYTGEQVDDSGLSYLRARYYDPTQATFASLDPLETANRYAYVSGNPINLVDPSGLQEEHPEDFTDCVEPLLSRNFPRYIHSCRMTCNQDFPQAWQGIQRASCRIGCWGANRYRRVWRNEVVEGIYDVTTHNATYQNLIDIDKFVWISNTVAELVDDNQSDYLYIMNSLLLGLKTSGTLNTSLSQYYADTWPWYNTSDNFLEIGDNGIHCDYRDATTRQISNHIWAFTSAAAGSMLPLVVDAAATHIGVYLHEHLAFDSGGSWQDYLAGIVGVVLGQELQAQRIRPRDFGNVFRATFQQDFCTVMPDWTICTNRNRQGRDAYQFLEQDTPLWFGGIVNKDLEIGGTGCP